jgi:6-pyruvoyl-tetrahydropterin synthase
MEHAGMEKVKVDTRTGAIFIKNISTLDFAVFDPSLGIIGHSWHVDVTIKGSLDENGFVYDFGLLKNLIKTGLDSTIDHSLVIPISSQAVRYSDAIDHEHWRMHTKARPGQPEFSWEYKCPKGAVFPVRAVAITKPILESELAKIIRHRLPETVFDVSLFLREEAISASDAYIRYTHGLDGHRGLCQRLYHGHKSCIEIFVDNERRGDLEHMVARQLLGTNVHIAAAPQILSGNVKAGERLEDDYSPITVGYRAEQGYFEATMPANRVYLVKNETSIESITAQIAEFANSESAGHSSIKVLCFEGINKGAIVDLS